MVVDYSKGVIYVIKNDVNNEIYVGGTTRNLRDRFRFTEHIHDACRARSANRNNRFYLFMKAIGFEHFYIELYEKYPCSTKHELGMREKSVIRDIGTLNTYSVEKGYVKVTLTYHLNPLVSP
jgi:hypothetical protein